MRVSGGGGRRRGAAVCGGGEESLGPWLGGLCVSVPGRGVPDGGDGIGISTPLCLSQIKQNAGSFGSPQLPSSGKSSFARAVR